MIVKQEIDGRQATVMYLTQNLKPASENEAELVRVVFEDGESLWLVPEKETK